MDAITFFKKKSWWITILLFASLLAVYKLTMIYVQVQQTMNDVYTPVRTSYEVSAQTHEPFSILLLGVDERGEDSGRSDAMIVMTVNGQLETTKMLSIPRDTRVEIDGKGFEDKINHAYAFGGPELAVQTVEQFLAIPIHYVVCVNMESFVDFIDLVDGITVHNPFEFHYEGAHFPEGEQVLTGERALQYVRMRFDDPAGDFGRQHRQRQVLEGLFEKGKSLDTLFQYEKILQIVKAHVEMNLTFQDALMIQKNYDASLKNIETLSFLQGHGERIHGIYYYMPDEAELKALQQVLQTHLQLPVS